MKKFFVFLCAAVFALSASAQVTWNIKAGIGSAWCAIDDPEDLGSSKAHIVGKLGVGLETPLTENFSLMPSFEFAVKGCNREYSRNGASLGNDKVNLTYIQLPIMAAYRFNATDRLNIAAKLGPYFAYALSGKCKVTDNDDYYDYDIFEDGEGGKRFDAGLIIGVDFEFNRFVAGLEYERGFTNLLDFTDDEGSVKIKNSAIYLTVGYKF